MKEFGDTAVIIKDMNEFLLRLMKGIEKIGKKVCLLMEKVEYYSFDETKILNPLFNKKQDHEYQNELRIAIGRLDLNKPTSDDKYELCTSTEPLKVEIGDISDITIVLPIDDFCALKRLDSAIFPMIDRRSDIFNRLLKETQETMSGFESRKQTFTFDIQGELMEIMETINYKQNKEIGAVIVSKEREVYIDAVKKALDFVNAFEKLSEDNQKRLIYEVVEIKGKLEIFNVFNAECLRQKLLLIQ